MVFQCLDGICGGFLRGIKERKIPDQHHITLVLHAESAHRGGIAFLRNGENTEALVVEIIHCFENPVANLIGQRLHAVITLRKGADGEHFFHSTLRHHLGFTLLILNYRGQAAAGEVKGNLVHLHIIFRQIKQTRIRRFFFLCLLDNR